MFLKCRDQRIDFEAESLQFVPRGTKLEERKTLLVLRSSSDAPAHERAVAHFFSALQDDHHVVHARVDTSGDAQESSSWNRGIAGAVEEFCRQLELQRLCLASASSMIPAALSLAICAPEVAAKLILISETEVTLPLDAQHVSTLVMDSAGWPAGHAAALQSAQAFLRA